MKLWTFISGIQLTIWDISSINPVCTLINPHHEWLRHIVLHLQEVKVKKAEKKCFEPFFCLFMHALCVYLHLKIHEGVEEFVCKAIYRSMGMQPVRIAE